MNRLGNRTGWIAAFFITFVVWLPCVRNDFVDWDDLNMIVHNPRFNPPTWASVGWYWIHPAWNLFMPMTTTLWGALARIGWIAAPDQFGGHLNPAVFHVAGVVLHALSTATLFTILKRLLQSQSAGLIGAMVFAVHPIQTEAVVFSGALNNPMACLFGLLGLSTYLSAIDPEPQISPAPRNTKWIVSWFLLLLAMLSKPSAVVLPAVAVILDACFFQRSWRKIVKASLPWMTLGGACIVWTKLLQHGSATAQPPLWFRPVIAVDAGCFYVGKIVWPFNLTIDYGRTPQLIFSHGGGLAWWVAIGAIAAIAAAVKLLHVSFSRAALGSMAIFIVSLLPNSGLLPFDYQLFSNVADRYCYFAMIGVALMIAALVAKHASLVRPATVVLILLAIRAQFQIAVWQNGETLFRHALAVNPDSWMSDINLSAVIADRSPDEAIELCRHAIHLRPDRADPWNTIGTIHQTRGDPKAAIQAFRKAHELAPDNPVFGQNLKRAER